MTQTFNQVPIEGPKRMSEVAIEINKSLNSLLSSNIGTTRPSYATEGMLWLSKDGGIIKAYIYNGTSDKLLFTIGEGDQITINAATGLTEAEVSALIATAVANIDVVNATVSARGIIELANQAEARAGTDNERAMTPVRVTDVVGRATPNASQSTRGLIALATIAEAAAGTQTTKAVTPRGAKESVMTFTQAWARVGNTAAIPAGKLGNALRDTAAQILTKLTTVDGPGSGLNADLLDGLTSSVYLQDLGTLDDLNTIGISANSGSFYFPATATNQPSGVTAGGHGLYLGPFGGNRMTTAQIIFPASGAAFARHRENTVGSEWGVWTSLGYDDTAVRDLITNEVTAREEADTVLGTRIDDLPTTGGTATPNSWMKRSSTSVQALTDVFINVPFATLVTDESKSDITYADGMFTAVVAGNYRFGGLITIHDAVSRRAQAELQIYVDGVARGPVHFGAYIRNINEGVRPDDPDTEDDWTIGLTNQPFALTAGQTIEVRVKRATSSTTTTINGTGSLIWLERMTGDKGGLEAVLLDNLNTQFTSGHGLFHPGTTGVPRAGENGLVITVGDVTESAQIIFSGISDCYYRIKRRGATGYDPLRLFKRSGADAHRIIDRFPAANEEVSTYHGHGAVPSEVWVEAICLTASGDYAAGDTVGIPIAANNSVYGVNTYSNATHTYIRISPFGLSIKRKGTSGQVINLSSFANRSSWSLRFNLNR